MLSEERNFISKHILLSFLMTLEIITCRCYLSLQLLSYDCFTASNTFTCMSAIEKVTENGSCWESMSPCLEWHALSGQQELLALQPISTWPAEWLAAWDGDESLEFMKQDCWHPHRGNKNGIFFPPITFLLWQKAFFFFFMFCFASVLFHPAAEVNVSIKVALVLFSAS